MTRFALSGAWQPPHMVPADASGHVFEEMLLFAVSVDWRGASPQPGVAVVAEGVFDGDSFLADGWRVFVQKSLTGVEREHLPSTLQGLPDERSNRFEHVNIREVGADWVGANNYVRRVSVLEWTPAMANWELEHQDAALVTYFVAPLPDDA